MISRGYVNHVATTLICLHLKPSLRIVDLCVLAEVWYDYMVLKSTIYRINTSEFVEYA